jgi:hypothetical protein
VAPARAGAEEVGVGAAGVFEGVAEQDQVPWLVQPYP